MSRCGWLLLLLAISAPAGAHRLDEYLQATTIAVGRDHLTLQLRLTADVPVAPKVLADIGTRPQAYAEQVRRDLSLSVDDRPVPLRLVAPGFPGAGALRGGVGDIQLRFEADLPPGDGPHALVLENQHDRAIAVYLVNCRAPDNPGIRIVGQQRNHEQSIYRLDFTTGDVPATRGAATQHLASQTRRAVLPTYFAQGVRHILTGCDHLLFAACLVLAASTLWDLVRVITAFTVAHSITLTLAALGWVHLPASVVEPVIWASIVFVAVQNIFWPRAAAGWPWPSSSACFMAWALPAGSWRS